MTLPDVLVGLVLFGLVGVAGLTAWLHASRFFRVENERVRVAEAFDASLDFLESDLSELSPGDLITATTQGLAFRATRLDGHACLISSGAVYVSHTRLRAARLPQAGRDSLLVLVPTDSGMRWVRSSIRSVGSGQCGAEPAILIVGDSLALAGIAASPAGLLPVRTFEVMETRFYASSGSRWLGARSVSAGELIQPLAGPFESGSSITLRDSVGLPATVATVRGIRPLVEAVEPAWPGSALTRRDSAVATLHPRNLVP